MYQRKDKRIQEAGENMPSLGGGKHHQDAKTHPMSKHMSAMHGKKRKGERQY